VRKISPRRPISSARGVSRLSAHVESTCSILPMSDQTLSRARGDGVHNTVHTYCGPGVCEYRCEHHRHGRDPMSDRTSGAWSTCSLDGLTAWTRPEPTKWAVVVKDGARAREANLTENTSFPWFVARAQNITTTAHFVDSGRVQAVSPCREHALHAPDVRSDIRSRPWRRCSHLCSHPGTTVGVNRGVNTYATGQT